MREIKISLLAITLLSACATKVEAPKVIEVPVDHSQDVEKAIDVYSLESIIKANSCKDTSFNNRGKPLFGFLMGMSKAYQQTKCDKDLADRLTSAPHSSNDAFVRYGLKPTLPNIYAFMVGLAAQESSFKACEGRDMTAGWTQSDEAESGLFQTSLNSNGFSSYLYPFFKNWKKNGFYSDFYNINPEKPCTAGDKKLWGDKADGLLFQKMSKEQPAFQLEYTMLLLKETYLHHGPIVRREVKFSTACVQLFEAIDKITVCP
jgi:hypothetical protein